MNSGVNLKTVSNFTTNNDIYSSHMTPGTASPARRFGMEHAQCAMAWYLQRRSKYYFAARMVTQDGHNIFLVAAKTLVSEASVLLKVI